VSIFSGFFDTSGQRVDLIDRSGKTDPQNRAWNRFSPVRWVKVWGKNHLDSMGFGCHQVRCKSAVFWQTGRYNPFVSTGTEKGGFTGFSGIARHIRKGKGARFEIFFPKGMYRFTGRK